MRSIIVCGMDNSGKSTLVANLRSYINGDERLYGNKIASGGIKDYKEQSSWIKDQIIMGIMELKTHHVRIYDRFTLIEENVYGPVLRNTSHFSSNHLLWDAFKIWDPLIIYCRPSTKLIQDFGDREQMDGVIEKSNALIKAYDELIFRLMGNSELDIVVYDWTYYKNGITTTFTEFYKKIMEEYINEYKPRFI